MHPQKFWLPFLSFWCSMHFFIILSCFLVFSYFLNAFGVHKCLLNVQKSISSLWKVKTSHWRASVRNCNFWKTSHWSLLVTVWSALANLELTWAIFKSTWSLQGSTQKLFTKNHLSVFPKRVNFSSSGVNSSFVLADTCMPELTINI